MRSSGMRAIVRVVVRRRSVAMASLLLATVASDLQAQNVISVPFTNGFIGTRGASAGTANNVLTYATLGIARTFFIQNSSTNLFELQGNDIPGTLRIVRTDGTTLDIPASANWRNSGGTTYLIGILPRPSSAITFSYSGGSIQITDGSSSGGSSVGGYVAAYSGSVLTDGSSTSGNAAQSQVLNGLNAYLSTVVSSRPAGPVTVTSQTTTSTTPTIAGTATLGAGENLSVVVNSVQYTTSTSPALSVNGTNWTLALTTPLAVATHSVTATITNADGFTLSDSTTDELVITSLTTTVTIAGSFTANHKSYDGTTSATGTTTGLSLSGVNPGDQVTIASVTLAFQTAPVGTGKTVVITALTLGGANGAQYTVDLTGAPTATANVTAAPLTIGGLSASNKVYDGNTSATLTGTASYTGLVNGESFAVSGTPTATFAAATVGTGHAITVTGFTAPSGNYTVAQPTGLTANITPSPLTIGGSFTAANKAFDGTTSATITANNLVLNGVVSGDDVALTGLTATFGTSTVGNAKPVSLTAASLSGTTAGNYTLTLSGAPTTTANITAAAGTTVTIAGSFVAYDKAYDGGTSTGADGSGLTLAGVNGSDQVTIASIAVAFQTSSVGNAKTVVITGVTLGGADAASYSVDLTGAPTSTANIYVKYLYIGGSFGAANKVYDGTTSATMTTNALTLIGVVSGESVSLTGVTIAFDDAAVGTAKTVRVTGASLTGPHASNYAVTTCAAPSTTANISASAGTLTIGGSLTANDKTYDGTTAATGTTNGLTLVGVTAPDTVTIQSVTLAFQNSTVGGGKTVTITAVTLGGPDAAGYSVMLNGAPADTASILAKQLTVGGSFRVADKPYDGTTAATITSNNLTLLGVVNGDNVSLTSAQASFVSASVGSAKVVTLHGLALNGSSASNYTLSLTSLPKTNANITAAGPVPAPASVGVVPGDQSLALTWTAPSTSGSCGGVTGWVIEYSADGTTWTRVTLTGATPTATVIPGLTNNIAYQVRVAAVSACGVGTFSALTSPVVPVGPTKDGSGRPPSADPGDGYVTTDGVKKPVTTEIVQDTTVRVTDGDFALELRAIDQSGAPIAVDSTKTVQLEDGGRAAANGRGFAPGTFVTIYIYTTTSEPLLIATVPVEADGTFATTFPIADSLPPGSYTLQVNGVDRSSKARSAALGVEVTSPPPELELTSTPDSLSPAVGDTITITLTVTNVGRGPATDVVIPRAFREPGFTIVRTTPLEGAYDAATETWTIPRIDAGARARMLLTVIVLAPTSTPDAQ